MSLLKNEHMLNPSLKANIQDSLHFLMEINREIKELQSGSISQDDFIKFIETRSKEWGYISDSKHTFKVLEQIKPL